ncbi:DUF1127 domain-containing protein [Roseivivax sp. CAU 1761]
MSAVDFESQAPARGNPFRALLSRIGSFFVLVAESNSRYRRVEFLSSLSDAELEARGIRREDIVRHVFADQMYV